MTIYIKYQKFVLEYTILENQISISLRKNPEQKFDSIGRLKLLNKLKEYFKQTHGIEIDFDTKKIKRNLGNKSRTNLLIFKVDIMEIQTGKILHIYDNGNKIILNGERFDCLDRGNDSTVYKGGKLILKKWIENIKSQDLEEYNKSIKNYKNFLKKYYNSYDFGEGEIGKIVKNICQDIGVSEISNIFEIDGTTFSITDYIPGSRLNEKSAINELDSVKGIESIDNTEKGKIIQQILKFVQQSIQEFLALKGASGLELDPVNIKIIGGKVYITDIANSLSKVFLPSYRKRIAEVLDQ